VPRLAYELILPDGDKRVGETGRDGAIRLSGLRQRGDCKLNLPDIDNARRS
jgi:hypothetical protein